MKSGNELREALINPSSASVDKFPPALRCKKFEIHKVFLHFLRLDPAKICSTSALAGFYQRFLGETLRRRLARPDRDSSVSV